MKSINLPFGGTQANRLSEVQEARLRTPGFQEQRLQHSFRRAVKDGSPEAFAEHQKLSERLTPYVLEAQYEVIEEDWA